jgi:flagellar basal-body rod protein FlgC
MVASRIWFDTSAANQANMFTTEDQDGNPCVYKRRYPTFKVAQDGQGVQVASIETDEDSVRWKHEPGNPDAVKTGPYKGYVQIPKVDLHTEITNSMVAERAYEANLTALQISKQMISSDLRILG